MGEQDQPLAPAALRYSSNEENGTLSADQSKKILRRRKGVICCGCCAATTVIIGLIFVILALTVFKVKSPTLTINSVKVSGLDVGIGPGKANSGLNMSFISDASIKNPNAAGFKFTNSSTQLYYGGVLIGAVLSPPGNVGAKKTIHMNITIDVMADTVSRVSRFPGDVITGQMPMTTYTDVSGKVKVLTIKKHVEVKLNCTLTIVLSTQTITVNSCKQTIHL